VNPHKIIVFEVKSTKRKFFAVLHVPPVTSAKDAVSAAIVQEYKNKL
jgi:hypothetical protein